MALGKANSLSQLELRGLDGSPDLPTTLARICGTLREAAARMPATPMRIEAMDTSWRLIGAGAPDRSIMWSPAVWADALGAPWLRVFDGGTRLEPDELDATASRLTCWRELRAAEGWAVDRIVETHDTLVGKEQIG